MIRRFSNEPSRELRAKRRMIELKAFPLNNSEKADWPACFPSQMAGKEEDEWYKKKMYINT